MSAPKVGGHVTVRESALGQLRAFFGEPIGKDEVFVVVAIEPKEYRGERSAVHIVRGKEPAPAARVLMVWPNQVTAFSRCRACDEEGHTMASATFKNCQAKRDDRRAVAR
jgi:hypothetical protein